MLSNRIMRTSRALCSQMVSLDPTSLSSTKNATISLLASVNFPCAALLLIVLQSHSLMSASTHTLNMRLESGPLWVTPRKATNSFPKLPPAQQTICAWYQNFVRRRRSLGPTPYPVMMARHRSWSRWSYALLRSTKTWYSSSCPILPIAVPTWPQLLPSPSPSWAVLHGGKGETQCCPSGTPWSSPLTSRKGQVGISPRSHLHP